MSRPRRVADLMPFTLSALLAPSRLDYRQRISLITPRLPHFDFARRMLRAMSKIECQKPATPEFAYRRWSRPMPQHFLQNYIKGMNRPTTIPFQEMPFRA